MTNALSAATCAIYAVFAIPVVYLLVRHGRYGLLGWLFLFFFCTLRIIGGALAVHDTSIAANIISSVGLSPLLLAISSILHEARHYRIQSLDKKLEWAAVFAYHILVVAGVALTAAGFAKLQQHEQPLDKAEKITKAGISILAVAWGVLVGWTGLSFIAPRRRNSSLMSAGTALLMAVAFSLIFIGIRVFYSVAALCTQRASLNPTTGSLAVRVVLGFLPEVIATLSIILAGIKTQSAALLAHVDKETVSRGPKPRAQPWV
ncbi:hypothetical protein AN9205.2 [Aspergillus nidulans FGSC A4]|uniref:Integral membrane protein (AFU_orthologue AFUA_5G00100) n=1 Tax=Emericella nidulans (strain FGSC A4 / ATCC 38163 / CBS 112.46 / NRRL 194 / M139) TaxID=227321 RepID=Q5AR75_EMENI|nr:hypothetical protein [Aspergillus nidulans FGSC A4]EAA61496.1 hypothetical protein AN9205.2 [Aspergillus nidulans FGSC A4]CBF82328.1 TPA: integral membrane protein (AFU_orthologue; AFUA_5G00100) [Aspergillus nidulans FGSC A4]|eukprot:XP_682474.1 hypothetical protein AN9205.2 [Aspergillus nidulans FGSC A4]